MHSPKYLIVADDFTGSNDTGVQLKKNGISTVVSLFPTENKIDYSIVLDTESRTISAQQASNKVKKMVTKVLKRNSFDLVYKKIDSTIRGNIGKELRALIDVYKPTKVVFAPAFPQTGRTTVNSIQYLNDQPLMKTEMAKDPLNPIQTDNLAEIIEREFGKNYTCYTVDQITDSLELDTTKFHIFDIKNEAQLNKLAICLKKSNEKILYVGSAGLAGALFCRSISMPVLSVVGSLSKVSLQQINFAEKKGISVLHIDSNDFTSLEETITKFSKQTISLLRAQKDVILTAARNKKDYDDTVEIFNNRLAVHNNAEISRTVKETLALIADLALEKQPVAGMFLAGGDIAINVIRKFNTSGCSIQHELSTGVVESQLFDGKHANLRIVTKAGAFGNEDTLYQSIQKLKQGE